MAGKDDQDLVLDNNDVEIIIQHGAQHVPVDVPIGVVEPPPVPAQVDLPWGEQQPPPPAQPLPPPAPQPRAHDKLPRGNAPIPEPTI